MEEHDPTCSPRLRAAANAFAVELRDGAAEGGPFSVRDSFGYGFRGLFQPESQLEPFIARCKVLALKPDVSAKTIEAESLRESNPREFSAFVPPRVRLKPYEFGSSSGDTSAHSDEVAAVGSFAEDICEMMTPGIRESFLPGKADLPDPSKHDEPSTGTRPPRHWCPRAEC